MPQPLVLRLRQDYRADRDAGHTVAFIASVPAPPGDLCKILKLHKISFLADFRGIYFLKGHGKLSGRAYMPSYEALAEEIESLGPLVGIGSIQ